MTVDPYFEAWIEATMERHQAETLADDRAAGIEFGPDGLVIDPYAD